MSSVQFNSVQSLSCVQLFETPWTVACQASLSITSSQSLLKLMSIDQWCHPTISSSVVPFSFCPQSFLALGSFPTSWLFALDGQENGSFTISSSNEYSGLISFRIDWFDLLAVQGTLTSFLQQHSSNHPAQTFIFHRHREWGWSPENPTISWWGSLISLCHEVQLFFDLSIFLKDYFIMKHFQGKWMKHV